MAAKTGLEKKLSEYIKSTKLVAILAQSEGARLVVLHRHRGATIYRFE